MSWRSARFSCSIRDINPMDSIKSPLVSIITVVLNDRAGLMRTLESAVKQTYRSVELIVVDGGSTDGTKEVILEHERHITYWSSEPDRGVYDGMNKGILNAKGEFVLFLNGGDCFLDDSSLSALCEGAVDVDLIYGDIVFDKAGKRFDRVYPDTLDFDFFLDSSLPHPGTLIRRSLFLTHGLYDYKIKISADWAKFLDFIAIHGATYRHVNKKISCFFLGGLSSNLTLVKEERNAYLESHYGFFYHKFLELRQHEKSIKSIRSSRLLKLMSLMLPKKIQEIIDQPGSQHANI